MLYTRYQYLAGLILADSVCLKYKGLILCGSKELLSMTEVQNCGEERVSDVSTISVLL